MSTSRDEIVEFIETELMLDANEFDDDTLLFSSGLLDSFSLVELVSFLEGKTSRKFRMADVNLHHFDSIGRIVAFLDKLG